MWSTIDGHPGLAPTVSELSDAAKASIRSAVLVQMRHACRRDAAKIYCDKSLDSVHHLALVDAIFPRARYLVVFRHMMDMIASGLEASPWGFNGFGFGPFVQSSPGNLVAALANYWLVHVEKALHWEAEHRERCHRIRYEELARDPARVMEGVFSFLGVDIDLTVLDIGGPVRRPAPMGPGGDYKAPYNRAVHTQSVGRGKRVPVAMLPESLLEAANEKLQAIGYGPIDPSWNITPREEWAAAPDAALSGAGLFGLMTRARRNAEVPRGGRTVSVAVVPDDVPAARWVVDLGTGEVRTETGEVAVDVVVSGTARNLELALAGKANLGQSLHTRPNSIRNRRRKLGVRSGCRRAQ